jgi:hypothetical protein
MKRSWALRSAGTGVLPSREGGIKISRQVAAVLVGHGPEREHERAGAGPGEAAAQAEHAFALGHLAAAGGAAAEEDQLSRAQVQRGDLQGIEQAGCAGECQAAAAQAVVGCQVRLGGGSGRGWRCAAGGVRRRRQGRREWLRRRQAIWSLQTMRRRWCLPRGRRGEWRESGERALPRRSGQHEGRSGASQAGFRPGQQVAGGGDHGDPELGQSPSGPLHPPGGWQKRLRAARRRAKDRVG